MTRSVVLITGGNSGIGKATAQALVARDYHVIIAARQQEKSLLVAQEIRDHTTRGEIEALPLDLASFDNIRHFSAQIRDRCPRLDVLINNAGLFTLKKELTRDGFEMQIGVNHLGHFLLTQQLLPLLQQSENGRIINVSSMMHRFGKIDLTSFREDGQRYNPFRAYAQSKLANALFTRALAEKLDHTDITVNALHPGGVATDIVRNIPAPFAWLYKRLLLTPEQGAKTSIFLASSPLARRETGKYFVSCREAPFSRLARNEKLAQRLWEASELLTGVKYEIPVG